MKYPIHIGQDLLSNSDLFFKFLKNRSVCIISDSKVGAYYLQKLQDTCLKSGASKVKYYLLPQGESSKTLQRASLIWTFLLEQQFDRQSVLIALGGGMVGDLTGFCAACYLRGVDFIQCPTSLLAQIDAAIGGKTAVNHKMGKNLIGAFYAPQAVISDLSTLQTLPLREKRSALAELIKYGMIADHALFEWVEHHLEHLLAGDQNKLGEVIKRACEIKSKIVSSDEKEKGNRAILNFGHTVGHAIESLLDYKKWRHGEAVGVGMIIATHISYQRGNVSIEVLERLITLLNRVNLPKKLPRGITEGAILARIKQDKKQTQGQLLWVLLKALGCACPGNEVTQKEVCQALTYCSTIG